MTLTPNDSRDFMDFMALGATKNHLNIENLSKILDILAKISYNSQKDDLRQKSGVVAGDKFQAIDQASYSTFKQNLRTKLTMVFNSTSDTLAFFDLTGTENLRIDEFLFGIQFFISGSRLKEALTLF